MGWSTPQLAELAGTTVRAVRYYHQMGLLDEPRRRANGRRNYETEHLVRLLRIRRLSDLGFSVPQIADALDSDEHPHDAMRALDEELAATIDRLEQIRLELAALRGSGLPTDLPADLALAAMSDPDISVADRSLLVVLSRILGTEGLQAYVDMVERTPVAPATKEFDRLPADADEPTRRDLAARLVPYVRALLDEHPGVRRHGADAPRGSRFVDDTFGRALRDLYNPAQRDVMRRIGQTLAAGGSGP